MIRICIFGACVLALVAGCSNTPPLGTCPAEQVLCGDSCIDPQTSATHCGAKGTCVGANTNDENYQGVSCGVRKSCVDGACVCPSGQVLCGDLCIDPQMSATHCGARGGCTSAMAGDADYRGASCKGGNCVEGVCACPGEGIMCDGVCIGPQTSVTHCGAKGACIGVNASDENYRGVSCGEGQSCVGGACVCSNGQIVCGDVCIDPMTSVTHCGASGGCTSTVTGDADYRGAECTVGSCVDGMCVCPSGQMVCGGSCIDPRTSAAHCGAKGTCVGAKANDKNYRGVSCGEGQSCVDGACVCPSGQMVCGGSCIDPKTSLTHCGAKGTCVGAKANDKNFRGVSCGEGQSCVDGACVCPGEQMVCGDSCIDPKTSMTYCGAKGTCSGAKANDKNYRGANCGVGQRCVEGACVSCPGKQVVCGDSCIDPLTSAAHCGARGMCTGANADDKNYRGVSCGVGQRCVEGACVSCPGEQVVCDGVCIDPKTNEANCGAKGTCIDADANDENYRGVSCGVGKSCVEGACVCSGGQVLCGDVCINPLTSLTHCGARGECTSDDSANVDYRGAKCDVVERCVRGECKESTAHFYFFGFAAFIIIIAIITSWHKNKWKREAKEIAIQNNAILFERFIHKEGLPIAKGMMAVIYYCPDKIEIRSCGITFVFEIDRLTDVSVKTETYTQTHYVSGGSESVVRPRHGGGYHVSTREREKKIETRKVYSYLIFTYTKDNSVKYIEFDVTDKYFKARQFEKEFRRVRK